LSDLAVERRKKMDEYNLRKRQQRAREKEERRRKIAHEGMEQP
jgi:hypothetical protein